MFIGSGFITMFLAKNPDDIPPPEHDFRITDAHEKRITDSGEDRITD